MESKFQELGFGLRIIKTEKNKNFVVKLRFLIKNRENKRWVMRKRGKNESFVVRIYVWFVEFSNSEMGWEIELRLYI
jgi:hypothetical protein